MASQTTNLNLKKPALDDDALIADINNNMDTLDSTIGAPSSASAVDGANAFAKINSLNSNKVNKSDLSTDYGSKTTSDFQTALETSVANYSDGQSFSFKIVLTDTVSPLTSATYVGICNRSSASRITVILLRVGASATPTYIGMKTANGWAWNQLALSSELTNRLPYIEGDIVSSTTSRTITRTSTGAVLMFIVVNGTSDARTAIFSARFASNGTPSITEIYKGSNISYTTGTNTITITNTSSTASILEVMIFSGAISVA